MEHELRLDERRRRAYGGYLELDDPRTPPRSHLIKNALAFLAQCLHAAYGRPVYILIDEYDVPLHHAWVHGYYEEMIDLIGGLLSAVLKPAADVSRAIQRCILTGCLHVAQESIFTGANNLQVLGLSQRRCATALGFHRRRGHRHARALRSERHGRAGAQLV